MRTCLLALALSAFVVSAASAQVMIPDSSGDRIMLFDAYNGSLINADWLSDAGAPDWAFSTPKEALYVGSELWVADQIEDAVLRFDAGMNYIGSITGGDGMVMDNVRSLGFDGSTIYVTNASGAFDDAVIKYGTDGSYLGYFPVNSTSIFDAEPFMGDLLVTDSSNSRVDRYTTDGALLGSFATGLAFPEQVVVLGDNSVIVSNAIDSSRVEGVWHYASDGSVIAYVDTAPIGGPTVRGANLLGNGSYIISTSTGIYTAASDGAGGWNFAQVFAGASGQYVTFVPEPGSLLLLGLGGLALIRRR